MSNHLTPLEVCEALIGPLPQIEKICGKRPKAGYGWRRPSTIRPAGEIPHDAYKRALLAHSAAKGLGLTETHLIWGAPAAEIEGILAARRGMPPSAAA